MAKFLTKILFSTFFISTILSLLIVFIILNTDEGLNEIHADENLNVLYYFAIMKTLLLSVLVVPIYFNLNEKFKTNRLFVFLSFYLLPFFAMVLSTFDFLGLIHLSEEFLFSFFFTIPFFIILTFYYLKFRKYLKKLSS